MVLYLWENSVYVCVQVFSFLASFLLVGNFMLVGSLRLLRITRCIGASPVLPKGSDYVVLCPYVAVLMSVLPKGSEDAVNRVFTTIDTYAKLRSASIGTERSECTPSDNIGAFSHQTNTLKEHFYNTLLRIMVLACLADRKYAIEPHAI